MKRIRYEIKMAYAKVWCRILSIYLFFFNLIRKDGEIGPVCSFILRNCSFVYAGKWEQAKGMDF